MTQPNAVEVLDHNDALAHIVATILRDCTQAGLRAIHVGVANYGPDYCTAQVQFPSYDTEAVDRFADAYRLHPDTPTSTNYERRGVCDIGGQLVTVLAFTVRPRLRPPADYRPVQTDTDTKGTAA